MYNINWPAIEAIGTCLTGIALAVLAWRQNEINKKSQKIELALRHKDHYITLMKTLQEATENCTEITKGYILTLCNEAELIFSEEIYNVNCEVSTLIHVITNEESSTTDKSNAIQKLKDADLRFKIKRLYKEATEILGGNKDEFLYSSGNLIL